MERNDTRPAVVITGASAGIGRALARRVAQDGRILVLVARSAAALGEAAGEVRAAGGESFVLPLDLSGAGAGDALEGFLAAHGLHADVLVNNAGFGLHGAAAALDRAEQENLVALNVAALTGLTLRVLPGMIARRCGGIINLGSVAGFVPGPYMALYFASKAFVHAFTEALAVECRGTGVTVTCVAPGPVETQFFERAGAVRARLFRIMPRDTVETVSEAAWTGFLRGRRLIVPGILAKLGAAAASLLPHALTLPVIARLQRGRK